DIVVTENHPGRRAPVGILTDRDIVIEVLAEGVDPKTLIVADIMSYDLLTAREDDELLDTVRAMRAHGVRRIPVVNREGGLEGIVSVDDLLDLVAEQLADLVELFRREQRHEQRQRA
ncbi:MAG TPA: CBS domain-containing protein, partial [Gammaproteobacteria bacterium]|nr:CBS domain-containing protein [Gammaproteobacteria bacterium]